MFKGLSDILAKFTMTQRLSALGILLLSGLIWKLGPDIIEAFKPDATSCRTELKARDRKIRTLQMTIDTLGIKVINVQRKCTNESVRRESEFIEILDELRNDIAGSNRKGSTKTIRSQESNQLVIDPRFNQIYSDTIAVAAARVEPVATKETVIVKSGGIENKKAKEIVSKIDQIKRKLENGAH
jgi:hypothetical protein